MEPPEEEAPEPKSHGIGPYQRHGIGLAAKFRYLLIFLFLLILALFSFVIVSSQRVTSFNLLLESSVIQCRGLARFAVEAQQRRTELKTAYDLGKDLEFLKSQAPLGETLKGVGLFDLRREAPPIENPGRPGASPPPKPFLHVGLLPTTIEPPFERRVALPKEAPGNFKAWADLPAAEEPNDRQHLVVWADLPGEGQTPQVGLYLLLVPLDFWTHLNNCSGLLSLTLLAFLVLGLCAYQLLNIWVIRPMKSLVQDFDHVAKGNLDHQVRVESKDELGLLALASGRFVRSMREAREQDSRVERFQSDLSLAEGIMSNLMPKKIPDIPGYDIFVYYEPAREVGGDYYDFIPVDERRLAFVVADVSGKSIGGALVAGTTRTILRLMAPRNLSPADVLSNTNYHVFRDIRRGMFVTCFYALLDVPTRVLTVASAGHNPMLVWRGKAQRHEWVKPNGIALGFDSGQIFKRTIVETKIILGVEDRVLLYSDGVVEAMNEERQEWGEEALADFMAKHADKPSNAFCRQLAHVLAQYKGKAEQHDDITYITIQVTGP